MNLESGSTSHIRVQAGGLSLSPALSANVLVLNRFYQAIRVINVRRAFSLLCRELAAYFLGPMAFLVLLAFGLGFVYWQVATHIARDQSAEAARLAQIRFQAGGASFLDVLDAQRTLVETESALAASDEALISDQVTVFKTLGGGWEEAPPVVALRGRQWTRGRLLRPAGRTRWEASDGKR